MSANKDLELSGTKRGPISKRRELLDSAVDNLGLNSVQTPLAGMIGVGNFSPKTTKTTDDKNRFNITVAGERVTVITNGGDFGLFEWFPTEIKLKIWKHAFEAPRIVSISSKDITHNSSGHNHVRLVHSGPQNPQLYVNRLTRQQAIQGLNSLSRHNSFSISSALLPKITFNAASDTIWLREMDFWTWSNEESRHFRLFSNLFSYNWTVQSLAVTSSSRNALMDWDNLHRLSLLLTHCFSGLRELIIIMDDLDLTTPGARDEISFVNAAHESFPDDWAVTNYSPKILSLSKLCILGVIRGKLKRDHWYTLVRSMKQSLKSRFMRRQETVQAIPRPSEPDPAKHLLCALQVLKSKIEVWNVSQGDEVGHQTVELYRKWTVPSVKFQAATTYKQLEKKDRS
ncbi:hypothetical protein EAE96_003939 [Botrytis aclada]|nr:hypothetical protein EAE96_003939 [Botrytis aclada]